MTIGEFLFRRLKEAGVRHLFGVPGDYNLELLQQLGADLDYGLRGPQRRENLQLGPARTTR